MDFVVCGRWPGGFPPVYKAPLLQKLALQDGLWGMISHELAAEAKENLGAILETFVTIIDVEESGTVRACGYGEKQLCGNHP